MPDRRGVAVLDDLPDDIIVGKILILLPPKDIGRCRMVHTSWRSATSTPEFMVEHRHRQPSLPIIDGNRRPASFVALRAAVAAGASSQQLWAFLSRCHKSCCEICLHASSDGFLIVSRADRFYICNPTTRKHALLPLPRPPRQRPFYIDDSYIHGLYQHKSTGEYRVLWSRLTNLPKKEATLYVLTVGANESRSIQVIMAPLSSLSLEPDLIHGSSTGDIIVFDTETESFRCMRNPAHDRMANRLFNMEGTLAFLGKLAPDSTTTAAMEVWIMQGYEAETWAFKYRIDPSMIEAPRPLDLTSQEEKTKRKQPLDSTVRFIRGMTPLNEHELLVSFNDKHVLRCETDGKFLGMVTISKR